MSIEAFIKAARELSEEIDEYFSVRPEISVALTSDAVSIDKLFAVAPSLAALLDKYGLTQTLRNEFAQNALHARPSSLRLLAQVFGHPWQHVNLEQALAEAVAATRADLAQERCEKDGSCGDCDCDEDDKPVMVGLTPEGDLAYVLSDVPLTEAEEAQFKSELGDTEKAVVKHDAVNHPKHYTSHPSGVECIEISEKLSFNLGNAFKYVFRRDDKENTLQDVSKAEWYLKREIGRLEGLIETMPASVELLMHPNLTNADNKKIQRIIATESNDNAADYYTYLFEQAQLLEEGDLSSLHMALESLQLLIAEVQNQSE